MAQVQLPEFNALQFSEFNAVQRRTRIKICGITTVADAQAAVTAGADAIGLVFHESSPRAVDLDSAAAIAATVPHFVSIVALVVDASPTRINAIIDAVQPDLLQFHGAQTDQFARQFSVPHLSVVRVQGRDDVAAALASHPSARGFLFDTFDTQSAGGTGKTFDWQLFDAKARGATLAGGLDAANVAQAIHQCRPYAVDVSSGVESAPGSKCVDKISAFIAACKGADETLAAG